jgi:hypothetical protein
MLLMQRAQLQMAEAVSKVSAPGPGDSLGAALDFGSSRRQMSAGASLVGVAESVNGALLDVFV